MVQRRRPRIIRGKWVNEKVTQGGLLEGKDWLKGSFGIMFDSEQCEIIFMGTNGPRTGMAYIFHSSLSSAVWRPDMGLKTGARMKSISETWVVEEAQELVLAKAFWEPDLAQEDQLQSWHLQDRIRTQMEAETKDVYPRIEKTSWLLPQMAFKYPICFTGYWSHDAGKR